MILDEMSVPKYQIGDRIPETELVVRGIAPQKSGEYLYFVQVLESDNTFLATQEDIENAIAIVYQKIGKHSLN
jgi:hypothetical protein